MEKRDELKSQVTKIVREDYAYGFHDDDVDYAYRSGKGLNEELVRTISSMKKEPGWMLERRLKALELFHKRPMPDFLPETEMAAIDFGELQYYLKPGGKQGKTWEEVPEGIKRTFEKLGIPEAERKWLAGVSAQYDSEVVYHSVKKDLEAQGVLFMDMDSGLREHGDIVEKYFGTVVPPGDNKFSALNTAVWSGGSFVYVPAGVQVSIPLQAYFRINSSNMGQFERTLIVVEKGATVHYIEGCTAPVYSQASLHAAVVELIAMEGSRVRYTTIQNWSKNVFNLVTKRAKALANASVEWVDGNLGSRLTAKYPAIFLEGEGARGEVMSVALASKGQCLDAGTRIICRASNTSAMVTSKSISKDGGRTSYRGQVKVAPGLTGVKVHSVCDALLMDPGSRSDTYPLMQVSGRGASIGHEATVSKIGADQLFYLTARGMSEAEARLMVVNGFIEPFTKELPLEYAVELNRLMKLEMDGSVG